MRGDWQRVVGERLARVCERCPHVADDAIELHRGLRRACEPGHCARAFFELVSSAGEELPSEVGEIGEAVKRTLAVEATGPDGRSLERVEFAPESHEDIEAYCRRMIGMFWMDRNYAARPLRLRFCYR